jgi:hypothetical protein
MHGPFMQCGPEKVQRPPRRFSGMLKPRRNDKRGGRIQWEAVIANVDHRNGPAGQ